ncbi:DapH/DapD/GlmU-related protein [Dickeya dadantii]|uniref:Chloramphenicol acetyltransferase n=1 Tax=Dickeya dadantii (strain 3937) TaxID=198628 RepID=E0SJZ0_DICD3|nr:DapH/DapD/GlmU-related protein [Dickeya dadantii]ADM96736.1 Chloramphenicol acetyltransferase [Dickeya dadantii 3937]NAT78835.1 acetyltransferase [Dickeya dadantii]NPE53011.1 acetyltransferase [Dickeya dadantii]NPE55578.1 acetyltransferase [Dickeya dadantii]NPE63975.1 acetyltransferase [Dickeya dadantii]
MCPQPPSPVLSPEPRLASDVKAHHIELGRWTEVAERTVLNHVSLGDYSYIMNDCDLMFTRIGKFTSIASHVRINPSNHPWWRPTLHHFTYRPGKYRLSDNPATVDEEIFTWRQQDNVVIGHDVWIGHGAIVLPGVTIGNGAIVGAGSIVTKSVPAWTVVVGNPARVLRPRFEDPAVAEKLEQLSWWDWPDEKIRDHLHLFQQDVTAFVDYFYRDPSLPIQSDQLPR